MSHRTYNKVFQWNQYKQQKIIMIRRKAEWNKDTSKLDCNGVKTRLGNMAISFNE